MNVGIIGLGSIGSRHAANLVQQSHTVTVYDSDERKDMIYERAKDLLSLLKKVDVVIIASPSSCHTRDLEECILARKHCFVEKPIAVLEPRHVASLLNLAKEQDLVVFCGVNLRFHSCIKQVKGWMADAIIGHPIWANFIVAQHNIKYQESVILNWGAHEVDLALYLLGPAEVGTCIGNRDIADVVLLHKSGCRTAIHMDYLTHPEERGFIIAGTDGLIKCNLVDREAYIMTDDGITKSFDGTDNWDMNYYEEMQAFIDRIDGEKTLGATGEEGLACLELLLQAEKIAGITQ